MIDSSPAALAHWYAEPLDPQQAELRLREGRRHAQAAYRQRRGALGAELEQLVAAFWLGRPVDDRLAALAIAANDDGEAALTHLVHGQLLLSRRLSGAGALLEQGFELARGLFLPADFFTVLKRHELLAELPLGPQPRSPLGLDDLLREARVIRRLRGERRRPLIPDRSGDTTG